jgi:hypothetical protein
LTPPSPSILQPATAAPSSSPPDAFPTEIYPDPIKGTGSGAGFLDVCPNPVGVDQTSDFPVDTAIPLINTLHSGDSQKEKSVTDPAAWRALAEYAYVGDPIDASWLDGSTQPAANSPYAGALAGQCGQEIIDHSWMARVCPEPCALNSSESLKAEYFFLERGGVFLIWFIWP